MAKTQEEEIRGEELAKIRVIFERQKDEVQTHLQEAERNIKQYDVQLA